MSEDDKNPQQSKPPVVRREDGTIASGTPNPGGIPKWLKGVRDSLKSLTPLAATTLESVMRHGENDKDRVAAAKVVLEYTVPKPKQTLKVSGDKSAPLSALSLEDLLVLGRGVKKTE